jgi:hypothetical protein
MGNKKKKMDRRLKDKISGYEAAIKVPGAKNEAYTKPGSYK